MKLSVEQVNQIRQQDFASVRDKQVPPIERHREYRSATLRLYLAMFGIPVAGISLLLLGCGLTIYLTHGWGLLCIGPIALLMMLMCAFIGIQIVVFPSASRSTVRTLNPDGEPFLHQFIQQLCMMLGAPAPTRIEVDYELNASARLEDRGLVLRLGLPMVAGLDMNQLVGVVSHEIGHFTQTDSINH